MGKTALDTSRSIEVDISMKVLQQITGNTAKVRPDSDQPRFAAFSRADLLAVMGTLALLVLLLMPATAGPRANGQTIQCLMQLRQLMNAWQMYTADNSDRVPSAYGYNPVWVGGNLDFNGANRSNWDVNQDLAKSPLWPYSGKRADIWRCPSDQSRVRVGNQILPRVRSVSMNCWFNSSDAAMFGLGFRVYGKISDCVDPGPARTFLFLDERADSINDGELLVSMTGFPSEKQRWTIVDYPASHHYGAGNFMFVDGHSEVKKWQDPRTTPPLRAGALLSLNVPSPDNPDVYWLMDHATRKP
jgi:prepilin-type processing-associated H-X9-DG protein